METTQSFKSFCGALWWSWREFQRCSLKVLVVGRSGRKFNSCWLGQGAADVGGRKWGHRLIPEELHRRQLALSFHFSGGNVFSPAREVRPNPMKSSTEAWWCGRGNGRMWLMASKAADRSEVEPATGAINRSLVTLVSRVCRPEPWLKASDRWFHLRPHVRTATASSRTSRKDVSSYANLISHQTLLESGIEWMHRTQCSVFSSRVPPASQSLYRREKCSGNWSQWNSQRFDGAHSYVLLITLFSMWPDINTHRHFQQGMGVGHWFLNYSDI